MDTLKRYNNLPTVVLLSIIALVGTLANLIILYVYLFKFPRTAFNLLIAVLSSVDLFFCCLVIPLDASTLARPDILSPSTVCGILGVGVCSLGVTSGLILAAIAYIRYRLVCQPHAEKITLFQARCFTGVAFLLGFVFGWPPAVVTKETSIVLDSATVLTDCGIDEDMLDTVYPMAFYITQCMEFNVIMVALSFWYTKLARILWSRRKIFVVDDTSMSTIGQTNSDRNVIILHIPRGDNSNTSSQSTQKEATRKGSRYSESSRAVVMMFIVTLVFFISYLPHFALVFFGAILKVYNYNGMASYSIIYRFVYANNFANFIIYTVVNRAFKKQVSRILKCPR